MGLHASFEIRFAEPTHAILLVEHFVSFGWELNDTEQVMFLPVGDVDYDWTTADLSFDLFPIFEEKVALAEPIGVCMVYEGIGGLLMIDEPTSIALLPTISTRLKTGFVDTAWYFEKCIVPADEFSKVESLEFHQHR